jgi:hypothetical protein
MSFVKDNENRLNYRFRALDASDLAFPTDTTFHSKISDNLAFIFDDNNLPKSSNFRNDSEFRNGGKGKLNVKGTSSLYIVFRKCGTTKHGNSRCRIDPLENMPDYTSTSSCRISVTSTCLWTDRVFHNWLASHYLVKLAQICNCHYILHTYPR